MLARRISPPNREGESSDTSDPTASHLEEVFPAQETAEVFRNDHAGSLTADVVGREVDEAVIGHNFDGVWILSVRPPE